MRDNNRSSTSCGEIDRCAARECAEHDAAKPQGIATTRPKQIDAEAVAAARDQMRLCLLQLPRAVWNEFMDGAFEAGDAEELERRLNLPHGLLDASPHRIKSSWVCGLAIGVALTYCANALDAAEGKRKESPWLLLLSASRLAGFAFGYEIGSPNAAEKKEMAKAVRAALARKGGKAKHADSPHAIAREAIRLWWNNGAVIGPDVKSGAAFDRQAVEKYPVISGTKIVARWRSEWGKVPTTARERKQPLC